MKTPTEILPINRKIILSHLRKDSDVDFINELIDNMMIEYAEKREEKQAVNFGTWYSGMKIEQVVAAYGRYVSEVLNKK